MDGDISEFNTWVFEKLGKFENGTIVAQFSESSGGDKRAAMTETKTLEMYKMSKDHNAKMPDDLKPLSQFDMEQEHAARKAIQDYKIKKGIKLDTPPVDLEDPCAENGAANDPVFYTDNVVDLNLG